MYGGVGKWEETGSISYLQKLKLPGCRSAKYLSPISMGFPISIRVVVPILF